MKAEWEEMERVIENAYKTGVNADITELYRLMHNINSEKDKMEGDKELWYLKYMELNARFNAFCNSIESILRLSDYERAGR